MEALLNKALAGVGGDDEVTGITKKKVKDNDAKKRPKTDGADDGDETKEDGAKPAWQWTPNVAQPDGGNPNQPPQGRPPYNGGYQQQQPGGQFRPQYPGGGRPYGSYPGGGGNGGGYGGYQRPYGGGGGGFNNNGYGNFRRPYNGGGGGYGGGFQSGNGGGGYQQSGGSYGGGGGGFRRY